MIDVLLLLMAIIWGTNYSIIKFAFAHVDPQAFNSARMVIASVLFLVLIACFRRWRVTPSGEKPTEAWISIFRTPTRMTRRDLLELAALGFVGHFLYQYFFIGGLALTTVANSSLMLAATPVLIALIGAMWGLERVGARHWAGAALSLAGIYIVVGRGVDISGKGVRGDVMMIAAVACWAIYTLGSRRLISRHSPVGVTGLSMAIGTLFYVPVMWSHVRATDWGSLGWQTWLAIVYSSVFALGVAYTIWYAGVRQIGSARTSVYSNVIPIVAMITAVIFLGEPLTVTNVLGAAAVLVGVGLTRG
jgi:drug/metabolite transporter (DMT)-like permease